jgi:PAS domain S-box-containing protein
MTSPVPEPEKLTLTAQDTIAYCLNQAFTPFAILKGRDLVFTFANTAYVELVNGRELQGRPLQEAIPELRGQPLITLLEKAFDTGIPIHLKEIATTPGKDNSLSTRLFHLNYTPYKNETGNIEGIMAIGYDVPEQLILQEEEERHILREQSYNLFMQAPVGFSVARGEHYIMELVNKEFLRLTGRGPEIIGKPIIEVFPEIAVQGYLALLNRVLAEKKTMFLNESPAVILKNGLRETMYINTVLQPYFEGDQPAGVLSILTDVTEQVLLRKEAEELGERFETMANNIPNLAWIANADGWIFWYNSRWYEYTGTTPEEMSNLGWKSVHNPGSLPLVIANWQNCIRTGESLEMVFSLKGADQSFRPFLTRIVPIRNNEGHIIRWLGTSTDITRQKELERIKDNFFSMASHELKTPLTTIKAYAQISETLLEQKGDVETLGMIRRMGIQVNKLTHLIEDLLDFTKMQNDKLTFKEGFFDFNDMLRAVIDDMQQISYTHEIKTEIGNNAMIFGDREKISQVLNNLISNAIKYSPKANQIILQTKLQRDGILISVRDFGIGIASGNVANIFEQFYRVNENSQSTFPGMGIGLYICSEVIKRQGGKIWVESTLGEGSTFHSWFPFDHRNKTA